MKKIITLLFLLPMMASAQDTLITVLGDTIPCRIKAITPEMVSYSTADFPDNMMDLKNVKQKLINGHPYIPGMALTPYSANPQNEIHLAGLELQKASKTWYSGFVIMLAGGILTGTGAALINKSPSASTGLFIGGGLASFFGGVTMVASFSRIGSAGVHLDAYEPEKK